MPFGAHMSIAGGLHNALLAAKAARCEAVALFVKSSNRWDARPLTAKEIRTFRRTRAETRISPAVAHASYLVNLASPDDRLWERSVAGLGVELERCGALGIPYLVVHPGAHTGSGEAAGLRRIAAALDRLHAAHRGRDPRILLETTAGQGTCLGHRFEHLRAVLDLVRAPDRLGVCFDTCHVFAAGYDLRTPRAYGDTMREFDRVVGIRRIRAFHLNDSQKELGSRVDRHTHIGKGFLGREAFRSLVRDPRFRRRPMILETPKEGEMDRANLRLLRALRGQGHR
jgi:deoxyribonuclease-4